MSVNTPSLVCKNRVGHTESAAGTIDYGGIQVSVCVCVLNVSNHAFACFVCFFKGTNQNFNQSWELVSSDAARDNRRGERSGPQRAAQAE